MPRPNQGESRDEFIERCMGDAEARDDFPDPDQRLAVCNSLWENRSVNDNHLKLIAELEKRALGARGSQQPQGFSLKTADYYVGQVSKCLGTGLCQSMAGVDLKTALGHAGTVLTLAVEPLEKGTANEAEIEQVLPEAVVLSKHTRMLLQHKVTTQKEDRDKDVLRTDGAILDPKSPLLWQHMHPIPVGKVLTTLEHTKDVLRVASVLLDLNELTTDISKLIEADVLRFSHGFRALEFNERKEPEGEQGMFPGFEITKFEIMEVSLVSVPSNTDAEIELYSNGKLASDFFKAKAKSEWDGRTKQAPGLPQLRSDEPEETDDKSSEDAKAASEDATPAAEDAKEACTCGGEPDGSDKSQQQLAKDIVEAWDGKDHNELIAVLAENIGLDLDEKRGASLSRANQNKLQAVRDDIAELMEKEDLSRGGNAICNRCVKTLDEMLKPREDDDDDDGKAATADNEQAATEQEPKVIIETREPTWGEIRAAVLMAMEMDQRSLCADLEAMIETYEANKRANIIRRVAGKTTE